jgi:hypothetical protein
LGKGRIGESAVFFNLRYMIKENKKKVDAKGREWYRIVGMAEELGVTDQSIRNWIDKGFLDMERDENGRPWVAMAEGVQLGCGHHGLCKLGRKEE